MAFEEEEEDNEVMTSLNDYSTYNMKPLNQFRNWACGINSKREPLKQSLGEPSRKRIIFSVLLWIIVVLVSGIIGFAIGRSSAPLAINGADPVTTPKAILSTTPGDHVWDKVEDILPNELTQIDWL